MSPHQTTTPHISSSLKDAPMLEPRTGLWTAASRESMAAHQLLSMAAATPPCTVNEVVHHDQLAGLATAARDPPGSQSLSRACAPMFGSADYAGTGG